MTFKNYSIGHFINQPTNPTQFEVLLFGSMDEPNVDDFHKHTFYEILWIEAGISKQTIDYKEYTVRPNSLFFISPNQVHHFEEWKPLTGGTILFTEEFFLLNQNNKSKLFELTFLDNIHANPCIQLGKAKFNEVKQTIEQIIIEQKRKDPSITIVQSLLHILVARIQRSLDNHGGNIIPKRSIVIYKEFKNLLEIHFLKNNTASFYSKKLNITNHHLNLVLKEVTGATLSQAIRERRILEVKRLLTFTNLTISEIAFKLNFVDGSYLNRVFREETAKSPTEFRNAMSEKYRIR
jgi:AraC family transcriptional regulator, transcriptional activator of pobA